MRFKADEIVSVLTGEIQNYRSQADVREVGRVLEVGDGIARIHGLDKVMAGERLSAEDETDLREVGCNADHHRRTEQQTHGSEARLQGKASR